MLSQPVRGPCNVVLYTVDLEPITVLQLGKWAQERLWENSRLRLAVNDAPRVHYSVELPTSAACRVIELRREKLRWGERTYLMLVTDNERDALDLQAAFLPGQREAVRRAEETALARGFLMALEALG